MNRFAKMKKERIYTLFETLSINNKHIQAMITIDEQRVKKTTKWNSSGVTSGVS